VYELEQEAARRAWEGSEEENRHGTVLQKVVLGQTSERVKLQKEWIEAQEAHRTRKLRGLRDQWAEQYEENVQWPFRIVALKALMTATRETRRECEGVVAELAGVARTEARLAGVCVCVCMQIYMTERHHTFEMIQSDLIPTLPLQGHVSQTRHDSTRTIKLYVNSLPTQDPNPKSRILSLTS